MSGRFQPWGAHVNFPDPHIGERWTPRMTLTFSLLASSVLWSAIVVAGRIMTQH